MSNIKLSVLDLRIWVHLGCSDHEKFHPQLVSLNIDLMFNQIPKALYTDNLEDTICYLKLTEDIKSFCKGKRFNLIEYLIENIRQVIEFSLGDNKSLISSINITLNKVSPPVSDVHGGVSISYISPILEEKKI